MKILIVDDENVSRKILTKKLEPFGNCTSVNDSIQAIELYDKAVKEKKPYDLITLDVSMPKMDGNQLLRMIRKKEQQKKIPKDQRAKIIMVTARMNVATIKTAIKSGCNGYLTKPVNKFQLYENLGKLGVDLPSSADDGESASRDTMVADIIERFYKGKISLPILPRIVQDVQNIRSSEEATIEMLAKALEKDVVVSARLISAANSSLYKGVDEAKTLNDALVRLGLKTSCDLVVAIVARDLFHSKKENIQKKLERLWQHSFACAALARTIAVEIGMENEESLFLMGIVHDIGKMLLIKAILDIHPEEEFVSDEILMAIHEIHTTFGGTLLKKLKFSKEAVNVAQFHHWNNFAREDDREILIIHLADYLSGQIGYGFFKLDTDEGKNFEKLEKLESFKQLRIQSEKVIELSNQVKDQMVESLDSF